MSDNVKLRIFNLSQLSVFLCFGSVNFTKHCLVQKLNRQTQSFMSDMPQLNPRRLQSVVHLNWQVFLTGNQEFIRATIFMSLVVRLLK